MDATHLHLILNHVPILGTFFGAALLAYAIARKSDDVARAALFTFAMCALIVIPVYLTGEPAEKRVEHLPGVSETIIHTHERAAKLGLIATLGLGLAAAGGLLSMRGGRVLQRHYASGLLLVSLLVGAWMSYVGWQGGQIRHTEIRGVAAVSSTTTEAPEREGYDD